jgi:cation:H+ antiporter
VTLLLFLIGLGLLIGGAEMLVRGSSRLAITVGITPLVVGLTVVAFGTSTPELAVSVRSTFAGQSSLAIGNVVGSNILNVLLILGLSALILPLTVAQQLIRWDVPLMIAASALLYLFSQDGSVSRGESSVLVTGAMLYIAFCVWQSKRESKRVREEYADAFEVRPREKQSARYLLQQCVLIAFGLGLLVLGAHWLVEGAVHFARRLGVSELIIGLTVIAVGTSLPEIAATLMASVRGERDIAVGNVIGSNLFNILVVLGLTGLVAPQGIPVPPSALAFDLPVMIAVAVTCLPIFFLGGRISRMEGGLFFGYYVAYTLYIFLSATEHTALRTYQNVMLFFVLPLTALTLLAMTGHTIRSNRRRRRTPEAPKGQGDSPTETEDE